MRPNKPGMPDTSLGVTGADDEGDQPKRQAAPRPRAATGKRGNKTDRSAQSTPTKGKRAARTGARLGDGQHIDDLLRPLAERPTPPDEEELNALATTMADHLLTCEPCQQMLSAIIGRLTIQTEEGSAERARGIDLLHRFNAVLLKARVRKQLDPYAAVLCLQGPDAAREQFPEVALHLEDCEACRAQVEARVRKHSASINAPLILDDE